MTHFTHSSPSIQELAEASERLGSNPLLIQAAGGNTSVKDGDTLWVKASGLWLRDALKRPVFTPVSLSRVRELVQAGADDPVGPAALPSPAATALRPSIETTLHALMPHRVVLHVHAVDAIAWAVMPRAQALVHTALQGLHWNWVDYVRPGLHLTRAVAELMTLKPVDVLLMGNHGLVVGGDTAACAEQRLHDVVQRLHRPVRSWPAFDAPALAEVAADTGWGLPANTDCHAIATDPINLRRAQRGVLYPDHVVFLGAEVCTAPAATATNAGELRAWLIAQSQTPVPPPFVAIPGRGVLIRDNLTEAAQEMLTCLIDVLARLPEAPEPEYLAAEEAYALAHWEAEKFRHMQVR